MNRVRPLISPAKVIKFCLSLLSTHLQTLYTDLDPVKDFKVDAQSRKHYQTINHRKLGQKGGGNGEQGSLFKKTSSSLNLHYLFPLLSMLAINAHSAYLLLRTNFTLYDGSPEMDRLFSHRLFPRACWPQGDVIANVGFVLAAAVFLALLLQEPFSSSKSKLMMMSLLIVVDQKGTGEEGERVRMFQDGKGTRDLLSTLCFHFVNFFKFFFRNEPRRDAAHHPLSSADQLGDARPNGHFLP